ncbi:STAS domain-containing protein [Nonomuraea sp. NPDC049152]|uniref:STAS domain-containing protein n=1 Tax=Nonomuraea sp. NPDC049152 TaxID=3154350 RepID=UPI0033C05E76
MNATVNPSTPHDRAVEPFTINYQHLRIAQILDPPGLRIEGELDVATLPALTWALAAITGDGDIYLDLAALTFIDVGCLRALVTTAARLEDGHVLMLRSASPQLRRLLEITSWHGAPQLRLQNAPLPALAVAPLRRLRQVLGFRRPASLA